MMMIIVLSTTHGPYFDYFLVFHYGERILMAVNIFAVDIQKEGSISLDLIPQSEI